MKTSEIIGLRLKRMREQTGMSQAQLAKTLEWSQSRIGNYESGTRSISVDDAEVIAKALGSSASTLLFGDEVEYVGKVRAGLVRVTGEAVLGVDGDIEMIESPTGWLKIYSDDPDAYGLRVKGDSMYPRIMHGEFVLIEPNAKLHAGEDVMVRTKDGHNMIKRLGYFRDDEYQFLSVNQDHKPITLRSIDIEHVHSVMGILKASRYIDDSEM